MKNVTGKIIHGATTLLVVGLVSAFVATAADAPQPIQPTQPDRVRGNRGPVDRTGANPGGADRGNFQGRGGFGGPGGPGGMGGMGGGINLDDKQRELYLEAAQKDSDALRKLDEKLRAAQKELMQAILAENYVEKIVREKADAMGKIQTEMTLLRGKAFATVAPTLKAEQREQLETSRSAILMLSSGGFGGPGSGGVPPDGGRGGAGFRNRAADQSGNEDVPGGNGGFGGPGRRRGGPGQP